MLTYQPKQGEIFQFMFDYFYNISYLYLVTFTIYNFLNAKINTYTHFKEKYKKKDY